MSGNEQNQSGIGNKQAGGDIVGRDINNTTHNHFNDEVDFDLIETEKLIDDLYEISKKFNEKDDFSYKRMSDIDEKNRLNEMEKYFKELIEPDIVYFDEFNIVLKENEDDFRERFEYIIRTIKGAILAIDNREVLNPKKINKIFQKFYKQDWSFKKKQKAERLIHFMYFACFLGRKKV